MARQTDFAQGYFKVNENLDGEVLDKALFVTLRDITHPKGYFEMTLTEEEAIQLRDFLDKAIPNFKSQQNQSDSL